MLKFPTNHGSMNYFLNNVEVNEHEKQSIQIFYNYEKICYTDCIVCFDIMKGYATLIALFVLTLLTYEKLSYISLFLITNITW
jgi:arginine repressor